MQLGVARNLYVAVQPAVAGASWPTSKMDFRSNEAGRTVNWSLSATSLSRLPGGRTPTLLMPPIVAAGASSPTMKIETLTVDFSDDQKRYLEGFTSGLQISRVGRGLGGGNGGKASTEPTGPDAAHLKAQDTVHRIRQEARRSGEVQTRATSVRCLSAAEAAGARQCAADARRIIFAGAITACSMSRRRRIPTCAGCGSRTGS